MRLQVNPNRMELMRLRRRLALAERGHKLLKDKLEEVLRRFLEAMRRLTALEEETSKAWEAITLAFAVARAGGSARDLNSRLPDGTLTLAAEKHRILNLTVPRLIVENLEISSYDLLGTEGEIDIGVHKTRRLLDLLLETAALWKTAELLAREIDLTRRRVNALEHILIPNIRSAIRTIAARLEEMERSYQVQLMRVKEVVRHH